MSLFKRKSASREEPKIIRNESSHSLLSSHSHDESSWLISYADMMTLLCGFFIMLFSMSKLDNPQYDSFKSAMAKQFGGEYVSATKELAFFATQIIQELGIEKQSIIKSDPYGVSVTFESTIFFDTLSAEASTEGKRILNGFIEKIMKKQKQTGKYYKIIAEGHTDSRPVVGGTYPTNWELSASRAARVVRMFLGAGFPPDHLTAIGYADTRPLVEVKTASGTVNPDALAKNRRVVLRILEPNTDSIPYPDQTTPTAR